MRTINFKILISDNINMLSRGKGIHAANTALGIYKIYTPAARIIDIGTRKNKQVIVF